MSVGGVTVKCRKGADETLGNLGKVLALLKVLQGDLGKFVKDPGGEPVYILPPAAIETVERLAHLTGLSALEREFVNACASDHLPDAWDGRLAYADWLEERGDTDGGLRVRKLAPQTGDVLVFHYTGPREKEHDAAYAVSGLADALAARGCVVTWTLLPPGVAVKAMSESDMARYGWVRAARVAEEREACARLAERPYGDEVAAFAGDEPLAVGGKIATAIRARGGENA